MREALEKEGLYDPENILFLLAIHFQDLHPEMLDYVSSFNNANLLSRLYCEMREGKVRLKSGVLFSGDFLTLLRLLGKYFVNSYGHLNRPCAYSIKLNSKEAQEAFMYLQMMKPDLNLDNLAKAASDYYQRTEYPKGFAKFLVEDAPIILMDESTN